MNFIKGNLALRDHLNEGKRVFLFVQLEKAYVKFEAELFLIDFGFFRGSDRNGNERNAIKFFFRREGSKVLYANAKNWSDHGIVNGKSNIPDETERKGLVTSRVGQGAYRKSILYRWRFRCAVTNYTNQRVLIASHIVPWKDATNEERLDVDNGILLSPTYDALFDQKLISFENSGKIILSDMLSRTNYTELKITGKEVIKDLTVGNISYLERHRALL